jgi:hypothetical protein
MRLDLVPCLLVAASISSGSETLAQDLSAGARAPAVTSQADVEEPAKAKGFVTGSLLGSQDEVLRFEQQSSNLFKDTGWDLAAGAGIGVFLTERWSLRAEIEIPRRGQTEYVIVPPQTPPLRIINWQRTDTVRRHITVAGLIGFHPRSSSRVRPAIVLGGVVAHLLAREDVSVFDSANTPWRRVGGMAWSKNSVGLTTGLDIETRITETLALVAQARASAVFGQSQDSSAAIARLGVGVRWNF